MRSQKPISQVDYTATDQPLLLDCPACHSFISQADINEERSIASCSHCDHVFELDNTEHWDPFGPPPSAQPDGIEVLRLRSMLELRISHYQNVDKKELVFIGIFSLLWNAALLPFIFNIVSSGTWILLLFISIHLFVGLTMLWNFLASIFNTTQIEVTEKHIRIVTSPLSLPGRKEITMHTIDIEQLYVRTSSNKSPGGRFGLYLLMKNGKKVRLMDKLNRATLLHIEREIEQYLEIPDRQVN